MLLSGQFSKRTFLPPVPGSTAVITAVAVLSATGMFTRVLIFCCSFDRCFTIQLPVCVRIKLGRQYMCTCTAARRYPSRALAGDEMPLHRQPSYPPETITRLKCRRLLREIAGVEVRSVDNTAVRGQQVERLQKVRLQSMYPPIPGASYTLVTSICHSIHHQPTSKLLVAAMTTHIKCIFT